MRPAAGVDDPERVDVPVVVVVIVGEVDVGIDEADRLPDQVVVPVGVGGLVVTEQVFGYDRNIAGTPANEYGPNVLFVRFRDGANKQAAVERLTHDVEQIADTDGIAVTPPQRSAEIVNAGSITGASAWLAVAIAVAAIASFALALAAVVRRRRRDLALLQALGFTTRQVSSTVSWHASTIASVGLLVGIPMGILIGRVTWNLFAHQLDVLAQPTLPIIGASVIIVGALIAANTFGALMGRRARTTPVGVALRDE